MAAPLKDVDASYARQAKDKRLNYIDAVRQGMCRPLGHGDVDIAGIVGALEGHGYQSWYLLEQDTSVAEEPVADVWTSAEYIGGMLWS